MINKQQWKRRHEQLKSIAHELDKYLVNETDNHVRAKLMGYCEQLRIISSEIKDVKIDQHYNGEDNS